MPQYQSDSLVNFFASICRQTGQGTTEEVRSRDFRRELEERERNAREKRGTRDRGMCSCFKKVFYLTNYFNIQ